MLKSKKLLSSLLAISMLASMSLSSFAADAPQDPSSSAVTDDGAGSLTDTGHTVTSDGTVKVPAVKVKLPSSKADILLNPYSVTVDTNITDQVISAGYEIENLSLTDVNVFVKDAVATSADPSKLVVSTKEPTAKDTAKNVYLVLRSADAKANVPDLATEKVTAATATKAGDVVIGGTSLKAPVLLTQLAKSTDNGNSGGKCYAKILGKMASAPTDPYTTDDKVTVTTTYVIKPTTIPAP